jgi:hypothetical protein
MRRFLVHIVSILLHVATSILEVAAEDANVSDDGCFHRVLKQKGRKNPRNSGF